MSRTTIAALIFACLLAPRAVAQQSVLPCAENDDPVASPLQGWVGYTNTGAKVTDMTVEVFTVGGRRIGKSKTNSDGQFSFAQIKSGKFRLRGTKKLSDGSVLTAEEVITISPTAHARVCLVAEAQQR
jgi:hypothetical protein